MLISYSAQIMQPIAEEVNEKQTTKKRYAYSKLNATIQK